MILYLLVPALILGSVEAQTANTTGTETSREPTAVNTTMKLDNVTSGLHKDEWSEIEDKLKNNQTTGVIAEDDENFQEQEKEFPGRQCHRGLLVNYSHTICIAGFKLEMMSIDSEKWCILENVIRPYNNLTVCLELLSNMVGCYYPNPDIQDVFLEVHSEYFLNCREEEEGMLVDAPEGLVIALTLIPVSLIPVLVYLVVWKSKVQD